MKPTKEEVIAEGMLAVAEQLQFVPVAWRFKGVRAVSYIKAGTSRVDSDYGDDGGKSFVIVISMEGLGKADWKTRVGTRVGHELGHVRLQEKLDLAKKTKADEDIEELVEEAVSISEAYIVALYNSRSPQ